MPAEIEKWDKEYSLNHKGIEFFMLEYAVRKKVLKDFLYDIHKLTIMINEKWEGESRQ